MNYEKQEWYDKTWLIVLLFIIFFPVGIYALWKNSHIEKKWKIIITVAFVIFLFLLPNVNDKKKDNSNPSKNEVAEKSINMDSIINKIKQDDAFEIKDVYYNTKDSSFNIAFTNKDNVIKDNSYSTKYFENTYKLDSIDKIEGIYLFEYMKGKSFTKNEYKNSLTYTSQRLARFTDKFDKKFFSEYRNTYKPIYEYLEENLNDPSSLEITKTWNLGMSKDSLFSIKTSFRAKNGFGALIIQTINCDIDTNGKISNVEMNK